ncbi:MAG: glutamine--fructose-6-phosphate transaminase (isomerizing) [Chloroflexota bacterium]|nr:glutamine--fructose-6-phosphate transaminase (isomerizing) [Chloroflexota bacterium]
MCGIIGYTGRNDAVGIILEALSDLEYRGYDSSGLSLLSDDGNIKRYRAAGKLSNLKDMEGVTCDTGTIGIGHTRWATHGAPIEMNAHPHQDCEAKISVVHNGIVENFSELKLDLISQGHVFESDTDAEVIPHLIESKMQEGISLAQSVAFAAKSLSGSNAAVILHREHPGQLIAFRSGNAGGLVVGHGDGGMLISSDVVALNRHTARVSYLDTGEIAVLTDDNAAYMDFDLSHFTKEIEYVDRDEDEMDLGDYKHYMLKEIFDQPHSIRRTIFDKTVNSVDGVVSLKPIISLSDAKRIDRVVLLGMGTSYNAATIGRRFFEGLAKTPSEADNSSEFRYRDPLIDSNTLVLSITQSGETADTLAAMETAKQKNCFQVVICNQVGTQATRMADISLFINAGQEIGVAATKTFTNTLVCLYLFAASLGHQKGVLTNNQIDSLVKEVSHLPSIVEKLLANQHEYIEIAKRFHTYENFLYLGRGLNYPVAMEGALKLKEISYIHAEGYPAGEMKHGPISLIDDTMPVVALIPRDAMHSKMLSNINEVKARNGIVIAVATGNDISIDGKVDCVIRVPNISEFLMPVVNSVPLQLLAYHIALKRGCAVDQPRNLAKSVTVE